MYGLLYKELLLNKKNLLGTVAAILVFSATLLTPTDSFSSEIFVMVLIFMTIIGFLIMGMFQQGLFEADESRIWQYYITSTPDGLRNQIRVKYVFSGLLTVLTTFYYLIIYTLSSAILDINVPCPCVFIALTQILFRSIEFPFLVYFGSKYGNTFRSVLIALIMFAGLVYALFGDLTIFGSYERFTNFLMNHVLSENGFSQGFSDLIHLVPILIYSLYYLSYRISCKLYLKGGEHYDR